MEKLEIQCEMVTPLLLHGENTKNAELRAPSIKGAMRFWWRAINGNLSLDELKKEEAKIFGGAREDSAIKSSFRIKLLTSYLQTASIDPLPHKKSHFRIKGYGESQKLNIVFIGKELNIIEKIFELTTILSGFGQRARRGFGSIQTKDNIDIKYIENIIKEINPNFDYTVENNYPYIKRIEIGKQYNKMNDLIKTISSATHTYNKDGMFGSVRNGRYASPVYISIIKDNNHYRPIITTLKATKPITEQRLEEFKGAIL